MKKRLIYLIVVFFLCFALAGCSPEATTFPQPGDDSANSNEEEPVFWETLLSSIHGEDIKTQVGRYTGRIPPMMNSLSTCEIPLPARRIPQERPLVNLSGH